MSYVFFWLASGWHLILLLVSTCIDWTAGRKMHETDNAGRRKRWLRISLVTNLSLLGVFKYLDFVIESWNLVSLRLTDGLEVGALGLALPVGISFYTFQTMSYTIDINQKIGSRISNMTSLKDGKPIDPAKNYVVAGWASVNEGTEGPAAYDLVAQYIEREKVIKVPDNQTVKVVGA